MKKYNKQKTNKTYLAFIIILAFIALIITFAFIWVLNNQKEKNYPDGNIADNGNIANNENLNNNDGNEATSGGFEEENQEIDANPQENPDEIKKPDDGGTPDNGEIGEAIKPDYSGDWRLILTNPTNILNEDFTIELEKVQGKYEMDSRVAEYAKKMINDALSDGIELLVCSAYRDVDTQKRLFTNKINEYVNQGYSAEQSEIKTASIIAVPGTSEHHTGLAVDIVTPSYQSLNAGFENTDAFKWLYEHARAYGFILRYPKDKQDITKIIYEPWHYRYVGVEFSYDIWESGQCLEEFLGVLN